MLKHASTGSFNVQCLDAIKLDPAISLPEQIMFEYPDFDQIAPQVLEVSAGHFLVPSSSPETRLADVGIAASGPAIPEFKKHVPVVPE